MYVHVHVVYDKSFQPTWYINSWILEAESPWYLHNSSTHSLSKSFNWKEGKICYQKKGTTHIPLKLTFSLDSQSTARLYPCITHGYDRSLSTAIRLSGETYNTCIRNNLGIHSSEAVFKSCNMIFHTCIPKYSGTNIPPAGSLPILMGLLSTGIDIFGEVLMNPGLTILYSTKGRGGMVLD